MGRCKNLGSRGSEAAIRLALISAMILIDYDRIVSDVGVLCCVDGIWIPRSGVMESMSSSFMIRFTKSPNTCTSVITKMPNQTTKARKPTIVMPIGNSKRKDLSMYSVFVVMRSMMPSAYSCQWCGGLFDSWMTDRECGGRMKLYVKTDSRMIETDMMSLECEICHKLCASLVITGILRRCCTGLISSFNVSLEAK